MRRSFRQIVAGSVRRGLLASSFCSSYFAQVFLSGYFGRFTAGKSTGGSLTGMKRQPPIKPFFLGFSRTQVYDAA
jgi:hypothetical protein